MFRVRAICAYQGDEMVQVGNGGLKANLLLRNGVVHLRWARGNVITEADARAAVTAVNDLCSGMAFPLLVEMGNMTWLSCKAQNVFAASSHATRVALLGVSPVDWAIAHFYIGRRSPHTPTRYFASFSDAVTWLASASPPPGESRPLPLRIADEA